MQVTVVEVPVQFQGVPVGSVPKVNFAGSVPETVMACDTAWSASPVGPLPLLSRENVTVPVPP